MSWPDYDSLPSVRDMPKGCAWGVFDKNGNKDQWGCLNKSTSEAVKQAALEIQEGVSVSLK